MATKHCVPLIHLCNFLDALFTLYFVGLWGVEEANPLMALFFQHSETSFLVMKFVCFTFAVAYLDIHLPKKHRWWVLNGILSVFLATLCWHMYGLVLLTQMGPTLGTH